VLPVTMCSLPRKWRRLSWAPFSKVLQLRLMDLNMTSTDIRCQLGEVLPRSHLDFLLYTPALTAITPSTATSRLQLLWLSNDHLSDSRFPRPNSTSIITHRVRSSLLTHSVFDRPTLLSML
jgi:hypothetical protein